MQTQRMMIRTESKGKFASKVTVATDELQYLMDFNASINQNMAKMMEHLTDFVFVSMANLTLARRDSYLSHLKTGIKPDSLAALRDAPLQLATLFPDSAIKRAEEDIANYESKGHSSSSNRKGHYHPYERPERRSDSKKSDKPAWMSIGSRSPGKRSKGKASHYSSRLAKDQQSDK